MSSVGEECVAGIWRGRVQFQGCASSARGNAFGGVLLRRGALTVAQRSLKCPQAPGAPPRVEYDCARSANKPWPHYANGAIAASRNAERLRLAGGLRW